MKYRLTVSFGVFFVFAVFLQWRAGAFVAEFDGNDEAAHLVTSLMVHDYVAAGMPGSPRKFAEKYYVRYPRVAFGVWPPLFHLSQAGWMLITSPSRVSALLMMALWAALLAAGCYGVVRERYGFRVAVVMGLLLVSLPEVQEAAHTVMADLMMSCLMFAATLFFWRYLVTGRVRDSLLFGVLAALAILVKYNALSLALLPVFGVLLTRRFRLLRERSFWLPALVVLALCGPWYVGQLQLVRYAMEPSPGLADIPGAMWANILSMINLVGVPLTALAAVGALSQVRGWSYGEAASRPSPAGGNRVWAVGGSLLAALWFFHSVLFPINDTRYFLAATPILLLFGVAGCDHLSRWTAASFHFERPPFSAALAGASLAYMLVTFHVVRKDSFGITEVAVQLLRSASDSPGATLVSGRATIEGMLISEMALRDRAQQHGILRASKVLASSTWMGANYRLLYQTPEEVGKFLDAAPVSCVVLDRSSPDPPPHHALLEQALTAQPQVWKAEPMADKSRVQVFHRTRAAPAHPFAPVYLDMSNTLNKSLEAPAPGNSDSLRSSLH